MTVQPTVPSIYQSFSATQYLAQPQIIQPSDETNGRPRLNNRLSSANQALFIGAKSLMASLNKALKVDGSYLFSPLSSQSFELKTGQGSILDKIDIKPLSFDFEAVAKNVMAFVKGVITGAQTDGASDEQLNKVLEQVTTGIDMGFAMAREELGGMNMLTDDVQTGIEKSYQLIQQSLANLSDELFKPQHCHSTQLIDQSITLLAQERGSLSITTLEGDHININFANEMSQQYTQSSEDGRIVSAVLLSNSQTFRFAIEGELDKDELKAVTALVKNISKLADEFFNGDIDKAWQQANQLDFNPEVIAQYALDFQEVKQLAIKQHYLTNETDSPIARLAPYIKNLNDVITQGHDLFGPNNLNIMMVDIAQQQFELMDNLVAATPQQFIHLNQQLHDAQQG